MKKEKRTREGSVQSNHSEITSKTSTHTTAGGDMKKEHTTAMQGQKTRTATFTLDHSHNCRSLLFLSPIILYITFYS